MQTTTKPDGETCYTAENEADKKTLTKDVEELQRKGQAYSCSHLGLHHEAIVEELIVSSPLARVR